APSGGGPSVEREAALHGGVTTRRGEVRVRTVVTRDGRLQGLNRPLRGTAKSAEPGSSKSPRRALARAPFSYPPGSSIPAGRVAQSRPALRKRPPPLGTRRGTRYCITPAGFRRGAACPCPLRA